MAAIKYYTKRSSTSLEKEGHEDRDMVDSKMVGMILMMM